MVEIGGGTDHLASSTVSPAASFSSTPLLPLLLLLHLNHPVVEKPVEAEAEDEDEENEGVQFGSPEVGQNPGLHGKSDDQTAVKTDQRGDTDGQPSQRHRREVEQVVEIGQVHVVTGQSLGPACQHDHQGR